MKGWRRGAWAGILLSASVGTVIPHAARADATLAWFDRLGAIDCNRPGRERHRRKLGAELKAMLGVLEPGKPAVFEAA